MPCVAGVVPQEKAVAIQLIAQGEVVILCVADVAFPVLPQGIRGVKRKQIVF